MTYEPELGQAVFSNGPWFGAEMQSYVERGIADIGERIAELRLCDEGVGLLNANPCGNCGAVYENDAFAIRAYCWCDGDRAGHEDGCPPNFKCGEFEATWYKYLGRGGTQNRVITRMEWDTMHAACVGSLDPTRLSVARPEEDTQ